MSRKQEIRAAGKREKQIGILTMIANHIWNYGYQPTLREIAAELGWESPGYVQTLLQHWFEETGDGRVTMRSRAIDFNWREYVTVAHVSWDIERPARNNTSRRSKTKRAKKKPVGAVSQ